MEILEVIFICHGCMAYNKHHKDDKDYKDKQVTMDSMTDALNHIIETGHYIVAEARSK